MTKKKRTEPEPKDEENDERLPDEEMRCVAAPAVLICESIEESEENPEDDDE